MNEVQISINTIQISIMHTKILMVSNYG